MSDLTVTVGDATLEADWVDEAPETRAAIADALPLSGDATRWGDELYFETPVDVAPENGRREMAVGEIAYWPEGNALCLFWGPTPASHGDEPRASAPVNVVAKVRDTSALASLDGGAPVRIERA